MSMLSCRVLCLLAIVLCCVGVAHAGASGQAGRVEEAQEKEKEVLKQKEKCENAAKAALKAADEAQEFVDTTLKKLETIAADPEEVKRTKNKGDEHIKNVAKAAKKANEVAEQTTKSMAAPRDLVNILRGEYDDNLATSVEKLIKDAEKAADDAIIHADKASMCIGKVVSVLQKLDAAVVAAAKEKKEKQVEPQPKPQEQTNKTSPGGQQGHTEGNQTEETQEIQVESQPQEQTNKTSLGEQQGHTEGNQTEQTQKEKQRQHYRSTVTINIHGDNLDALLSGAANNSGMALNDGSSSPALLRVPLLLLLLSVLGCMAVC
ncbi:uncharacterized protein TM35_000023790 [Trypanosoma theileri]|uniref:Surface protein TolT n=1 Tax=Trypanosoma theileri TaxID=67003 RepID=A0A1X0P8U3_9TRYP|nr:uncharacterized protein TM35_000023790 [Trypanosoma theileri]ORC93053.1 hypothetical protein TM35_000023790 [Trypanosoma theileri]